MVNVTSGQDQGPGTNLQLCVLIAFLCVGWFFWMIHSLLFHLWQLWRSMRNSHRFHKVYWTPLLCSQQTLRVKCDALVTTSCGRSQGLGIIGTKMNPKSSFSLISWLYRTRNWGWDRFCLGLNKMETTFTMGLCFVCPVTAWGKLENGVWDGWMSGRGAIFIGFKAAFLTRKMFV